MSFDLFFQPRRFGPAIDVKNPFTGKVQSILQAKPLSSDELKAVQAVLAKAASSAPDQFGCYILEFADGASAEAHAVNLEKGCMISVRRRMSPLLLEFLIELLKAGNWIMLPAMEAAVAITASPQAANTIPDGFTEVVCDSGEALGVLLKDGFLAVQKYRDHVVRSAR